MTTTAHCLEITFLGEVITIEPDGDFTFGRTADLRIDDNEFLHRQLGLLRHHHEGWRIHNVGSSLVIELLDVNSSSRSTVAPGTSAPISFVDCRVQFTAGPTTYELELRNETAASQPASVDLRDGNSTVSPTRVNLNDEQRLLLTALAEHRLVDRGAPLTAIPSNKNVATRLGWGRAKYNRKLDYLCQRFSQAGVRGLVGDSGSLARRRRERLVDYILVTGLITVADLEVLREADGVAAD